MTLPTNKLQGPHHLYTHTHTGLEYGAVHSLGDWLTGSLGDVPAAAESGLNTYMTLGDKCRCFFRIRMRMFAGVSIRSYLYISCGIFSEYILSISPPPPAILCNVCSREQHKQTEAAFSFHQQSFRLSCIMSHW